mmetsp:Transcript_24667/g.77520  ORF Transcript_24667/g.77520 Transcript_24667/m.77520 type:complete len:100 (-) Transcript_24667:91-390(-)
MFTGAYLQDSLEYHSVFVGHYTLGDVAFRGLISVYNLHSMYWKVSKTMADQRTPHVDSSLFLGDETGEWRMAGSVVRFLGPAGPFTFYLRCVCAHAHLY